MLLVQAIVGPLVETMRHIMGPRFNPELESVYTRAFSYVVSILGKAFDGDLPVKGDDRHAQHIGEISLDTLSI